MPNSPDMISSCIYYAIGDIHGEVDRLAELHEAMFEHNKRNWPEKTQVIVHLGDYVDRGPDACATIERLMSLEQRAEIDESLQVICLKGNHEQIMLDALEDPASATMRTWMRPAYGGQKTLESYEKRGSLGEELRAKHCEWFRQLPAIWHPDHAPYVFVHAGVDPVLFPLEDEEVYLWTRAADFFDTNQWRSRQLKDAIVVHGHTPTEGEPDIAGGGRRINVDTGAVYGGRLTCAVLGPDKTDVAFLHA